MKEQIVTILSSHNCDNLVITRRFALWHVVFTVYAHGKNHFAEGVDANLEKATQEAYLNAKEILEI